MQKTTIHGFFSHKNGCLWAVDKKGTRRGTEGTGIDQKDDIVGRLESKLLHSDLTRSFGGMEINV
jgi:hypothetical protein